MKKRHIITIDCKNDFDNMGHFEITRTISFDGIELYSIQTSPRCYCDSNSELRQFEAWIIKLESSHDFKCRRNRSTNRGNFMCFFQKIWRKFFAK